MIKKVKQLPHYLIEDKDGNVSYNIKELKRNIKQCIEIDFNNEIQNNKFFSNTLGIDVDCRRSNTKNDKQNVEGLISYMQRNSITKIEYKGYTENRTATIPDLQKLVCEMEDYVLGLYQKKWTLENLILNTESPDELFKIKWRDNINEH